MACREPGLMTNSERVTVEKVLLELSDMSREIRADITNLRTENITRFDKLDDHLSGQDTRLRKVENFALSAEVVASSRAATGVTRKWVVTTLVASLSVMVTVIIFLLRFIMPPDGGMP